MIMMLDKIKAKNKSYRISEKFLLNMGVFVGAFGSILGMTVFRHKNKKLKFKLVFTFQLFINIAIIYYIMKMA